VHICCNTVEEEFYSDGQGFAFSFPLLFHFLPGVCCGGIDDCCVIVSGFGFLDPCQVCEMVVLIYANNFS
jgi:hypothetical protein